MARQFPGTRETFEAFAEAIRVILEAHSVIYPAFALNAGTRPLRALLSHTAPNQLIKNLKEMLKEAPESEAGWKWIVLIPHRHDLLLDGFFGAEPPSIFLDGSPGARFWWRGGKPEKGLKKALVLFWEGDIVEQAAGWVSPTTMVALRAFLQDPERGGKFEVEEGNILFLDEEAREVAP